MDKHSLREILSGELRDLSPKAIEAIRERRVIKVQVGSAEMYFFRGKERDYLIIPKTYCSCRDFQFNVILRGKRPSCYHLIVAEVLERSGKYRTLTLSHDELLNILFETLYEGKSITLRKLLIKKRP